jgi:N-acetylmuramoyl-L-alanine amidase
MSTGDDVVQVAATRVGEQYILGAKVPKNNPDWKGPWDCAEFASWCVFQVSRKLYACDKDVGNPAVADAYTGYWARDAESRGAKISIDEASRTPGALVLRIPQGKLTGHIVISDGQGGTIEAHSSVDGVIKSTLSNRRWDTGVLVPWITYSQNKPSPVVPPTSTVYRVTSPLMRGETVKRIQKALETQGFNPGTVDGGFGPQTAAAVHAFQLSMGLVPDGEVGPFTAGALGVVLG